MIHVGDITKLNGAELPVVDVVTGGSPCQDLSVAGKRAGLAGERSGLFMEQVRIVKEMREHDRSTGRTGYLTRPRYMLWENVPGAFSSNKGEDFRAVLEEIAKVEQEDAHIPRPEGSWPYAGCIMGDGWSIAWRLHDAQFWGVPQRRKRIALVADFGGQSAPEILFEREGMRRDPEESGETREEIARNIGESTDGAVCFGIDHVMLSGGTTYQGRGYYEDVSGCLKTQPHGVYKESIDRPAVFDASRRHNYEQFGEVCETVQASYGTGGNNQPLVVQPIVIEMTSTKNTIVKDGICPTITARMGTGGNQVNAVYCMDVGFFTSHKEKAGTLLARQYKDAPIVFEPGAASRVGGHVYDDEKAGTVRANAGDNQQAVLSLNDQNVVRRLTPLECERLQGYPDKWTDIGEWTDSKGKTRKCSDSARYKALGNSIAIPFWFYILRRMAAQYERPATLGSLFDGIGGFPLCWERCNGKGTAVWASEVEEFPIAVTKKRFGDR